MFPSSIRKFQEELSSPDTRLELQAKHRLMVFLYQSFALVVGLAAIAAGVLGHQFPAIALGALALLNLVQAFRHDSRWRLFSAVSYLEERSLQAPVAMNQPAPAIPETEAAVEVPVSTQPLAGPPYMPPPIVPQTSEIITPNIEGVENWFQLTEWKVAEGSYVKQGEVVAELENDEIIVEVEVMDSGYISLAAVAGDRLDSGTLLASLAISADQNAA